MDVTITAMRRWFIGGGLGFPSSSPTLSERRTRGQFEPHAPRLAGMDVLRERFERDGFVGPIDVLSEIEVAAVRTATAEVIANLEQHKDRLYEVEQSFTDRPGEVVCHFLGGFRVHETLRQ